MIETKIRSEFAEAVAATLGELSPNQASYKTGISSEYIRQMRAGKVPSREVIARFAEGMGVDPYDLMLAAGYEQPADLLSVARVALRGDKDLSEAAKQQILGVIEEALERAKKYKTNPLPNDQSSQ